jgi:hypothetical protein
VYRWWHVDRVCRGFEESAEDLNPSAETEHFASHAGRIPARLAQRRKRAKFIGDSPVTFPRKLGIHWVQRRCKADAEMIAIE